MRSNSSYVNPNSTASVSSVSSQPSNPALKHQLPSAKHPVSSGPPQAANTRQQHPSQVQKVYGFIEYEVLPSKKLFLNLNCVLHINVCTLISFKFVNDNTLTALFNFFNKF